MSSGTLLWVVALYIVYSTPTLATREERDSYTRYKRQTKPIPRTFDARLAWPNCSSLIGFVHEKGQGFCTSSWALATAAAISDRICINSGGEKQDIRSAQDLLECCKDCGSCLGGQPFKAWQYWVENGIPTGGTYGSNVGCKPYAISSEGQPPRRMRCNQTCRAGHAGDYRTEKKYEKGMNYYSIPKNDVAGMQRDIMTYGPIVSVLTVFVDFLTWEGGGIYTKNSRRFFGHQSVKVIGWGRQGGMDYWLCTNSMGVDWGDRGLFKIRRGTDEVSFESYEISAGRPSVVRVPNLDTCQPTDLVFVVDGASGGVKAENTVINMVSYLDIPTGSQVGVVLCSKTMVTTMLRLGVKTDKASLIEDMDDYVFQRGTAPVDLPGGLAQAASELNARARPESMRLIVVLVKSDVIEAGLRRAAQMVKQMGIWIVVVATDSNQRTLLSRVASSGLYRFLTNGELGENLPEDDAFYLLPLLVEEMCNNAQVCWACMFDNGIYTQGVQGKCDQYWHCRSPGDPNPLRRRCPLGKFWDREILGCVWPTETLCWGDPCVKNINYWANLDHCGAYWQCNNTRTYQLRCCPRGQSWDQQTEACVVNATCNHAGFCFRERGCTHDFHMTYLGGGLGDKINQLYIDRNRVRVARDPAATDGWAAYFNGNQFLTVRFYANRDMGEDIQMYIRFRPLPETSGFIQSLITDGGCLPIEPALFLGYETETHKAHGYLRTDDDDEVEVALDLHDSTSGYIKLWYTYNGEHLTLQSETDAGVTYQTVANATGKIRKTRNALKIGSPNYEFFRHRDFLGYIDEVAVSRCENYVIPG